MRTPLGSLAYPTRVVVQVANMKAEIKKIAMSEGLVFGWANVSTNPDGTLIVDHHGDSIPIAELEKAAYGYVLNSRRGDAMHEKRHVARLVESFVVTDEKRAALGLGPGQTGWWVGFKVDDTASLERLKEGAYLDFSIGGRAKRTDPNQNGE